LLDLAWLERWPNTTEVDMGAQLGGMPNCESDQDFRRLAERVAELEAQLARQLPEAGPVRLGADKLATIASSIHRARQRRAKHFEDDLLGEPGWDMLLVLFVRKARDMPISASDLVAAAGVTPEAGRRWVGLLTRHKMVRAVDSPDDEGGAVIELSEKGFARMRGYILEGIGKFEMPMPD